MRRFIAWILVLAAVVAGFYFGLGVGKTPSGYMVQALFDNAGYAAPGEQVRIAGAPVGTIVSETVTKQNLAAVTLRVSAPGFTPWHANATCAIRPQSLIAERYVDCTPGTAARPQLALIHRGVGEGSHLLPVSQTSSPIDPDIVQGISTEPVREGLSTILDELGTGLAARGADLNAVILRADPGLAATNRVFSLLAAQDHTLAQLATDSDAVLTPLARARGSLARFVTGANSTALAAASQQAQISASIKALPPFLTRLRPLMNDLGDLAQQGTPALKNLGASAGALDREFTSIVPFASEARTALNDLSDTAARSESNLLATQPLVTRLSALGSAAVPTAQSLSALTTSLSSTDAISQLMAFLFNAAGATNGYDSEGHYLRTDLQVGSCTGYARSAVLGCSSRFDGNPGGASFTATPATTPTSTSATSTSTTPTSTSATSVQADQLSGLMSYLTGGSPSTGSGS